MGIKVLAGFVAAVVVTASGVYVAFTGGPDATAEPVASSLPVSEGSSCCLQKAGVCPDSAAGSVEGLPTDALAACTGGLSSGVIAEPGTARQKTIHCCDD